MNCLIIDSNYICHSVYHSMPRLAFRSRSTSIIFGFLKRVLSFANQFPGSKFVFVWDSTHSIRKEVYPDYKKLRDRHDRHASEEDKRDKAGAHRQFTELRENVLPMLGFTHIYSQDGYEADDLMASIKMNNGDKNYKFIIVTTDKDIYQLIDNDCMLFNPGTKSIQTVNTFIEEYGIHPNKWGEAKAIAGCSTDNVKGVKGVAEKTAIKYIKGEMNKDSKKFKDIEASQEITELNKELVVLPMVGTYPISISRNDYTNRQDFVKVCERYGFKSLLSSKNLEKWDKVGANG